MTEGILPMSDQERERLHVVRQAIECQLSQQEDAERLGIDAGSRSGVLMPQDRRPADLR